MSGTTNKNISIDSLDKPNGPLVVLPEHKSLYTAKPDKDLTALLSYVGLFSVLSVIPFLFLWWWTGTILEETLTYDELWITSAKFIRLILISVPTVGIVVGMYNGLTVLHTAIKRLSVIRTPGDWPVHINNLAVGTAELLTPHYETERVWAGNSRYRGLNGTYSPSNSNTPISEAMLPAPTVDTDDNDFILPTDMPLPPDSGSDGNMLFGVDDHGIRIQSPIGVTYHTLRQGSTGSGKTNSINAEITQVHRHAQTGGNVRIAIADFKGELASTWSRSKLNLWPAAIEVEDIAEILEMASDEITRRYRLFRETGERLNKPIPNLARLNKLTDLHLPTWVIYVDDANVILDRQGTTTTEKQTIDITHRALKRGLQLGRGAGIFYSVGAQYVTSKLFGRDGSQQFVTRAYFGPYDTAAVQMVFGGRASTDSVNNTKLQFKANLDGSPGRGLFANSRYGPAVIQTPIVSDDDIISALTA